MSLQATYQKDNTAAHVFHDRDFGSYRVRFCRDGVKATPDMFTDNNTAADDAARQFTGVTGPAPLSRTEFAAIVGPLLERKIAFDLGLTGCHIAWLTWNVGDTSIAAVYHDGSTGTVGFPCEN